MRTKVVRIPRVNYLSLWSSSSAKNVKRYGKFAWKSKPILEKGRASGHTAITPDRRQAYVEALLRHSEFQGKAYFTLYRSIQDYLAATVQTITQALSFFEVSEYKATVLIDGGSKGIQGNPLDFDTAGNSTSLLNRR